MGALSEGDKGPAYLVAASMADPSNNTLLVQLYSILHTNAVSHRPIMCSNKCVPCSSACGSVSIFVSAYSLGRNTSICEKTQWHDIYSSMMAPIRYVKLANLSKYLHGTMPTWSDSIFCSMLKDQDCNCHFNTADDSAACRLTVAMQ